jgi:hypothetical protein
MYLKGAFLGYSTLQYQPSLPVPIPYNKITFYGGSTIIDKIHIQNIELTGAQVQAINPIDTISWQPTTVLLANFDTDTLDGGNIISLPDALVGWKIYRTDTSTNISTLINTIAPTEGDYIDYSVAAYKTYFYEIIPYTATTQGSPLTTASIYVDIFGWYLCDYDSPSIVYLFDLNLSSNQIENETNVTTYETYTQKPVYSIGQRNYIRGSISCIAGEILSDGTIYQPVDYLDDLRSFINNGKTKILKSRKGHVWKVITYGMPMKFMDNIGEQVTEISFNFSEVE